MTAFSSFLTLRGIRTLALRMERHSANARSSPNGWNSSRK
ncbi:PLP-dependent transferase [Klebsiella pneumoniae subsp. pneumoniae]|nr:PLP-dependent transferase [Klebsiella pneumoniae subsp. pneumoniae]